MSDVSDPGSGSGTVVRPAGCVAGCSACCHDRTGTSRWVELDPDKDQVPAELTWAYGRNGHRYMRHRLDGACIALVDGLCSIYAARPQVCRDFAAGSWQCDSARVRTGQVQDSGQASAGAGSAPTTAPAALPGPERSGR